MRVREATAQERALLSYELGLRLTQDARGLVAMHGHLVRGGVLYDGWTENSVVCHMATASPMAWRHLLPEAFRYPFLKAGRGVLLGHVRASNTASVRLTLHLGFTLACRVRDGAAVGDDLLLFTLRREDCRWLRVGFRGGVQTSASMMEAPHA